MPEPNVSPKLPQWIKDHISRYIATNGADGHIFDFSAQGGGKVPTLLLTTTGRRSGTQLTLPLIYGESAGSYVIVASKGGHPEHPAWYLNLTATPEVHIQVKDKRMRAKARTATGAERAGLWREMAKLYPPYTAYQAKTTREIPVVVLEPIKG
jgi:deazaflavin-dependent oxidoreductase (nitroreductase family)